MIEVSLASGTDIQHIANFGKEFQERRNLKADVPCKLEDFFSWLMSCYQSYGIFIFQAKEDDQVVGLLVLNEFPCQWNNEYTYGSDLLFFADKGGPKLMRAARQMKEARGWHKLIMSTTSSQERSDRFYKHYGTQIGGVYEICK